MLALLGVVFCVLALGYALRTKAPKRDIWILKGMTLLLFVVWVSTLE